MRSSKIKNNAKMWPRRPLPVIAAIVVAGALVVGALAATGHLFHHTRVITRENQQDSDINAQKKKQATQSNNKGTSDNTDANEKAIENATTNPDNVTLTATQTSRSTVTVTVKLVGYSDGVCSLSAKNGSQTASQTAQVIYAPEFSTCAGFSIPVSQLGGGNWTISLSVTSKGNTQTKSTSLEVSP